MLGSVGYLTLGWELNPPSGDCMKTPAERAGEQALESDN